MIVAAAAIGLSGTAIAAIGSIARQAGAEPDSTTWMTNGGIAAVCLGLVTALVKTIPPLIALIARGMSFFDNLERRMDERDERIEKKLDSDNRRTEIMYERLLRERLEDDGSKE